MKQYYQSLQIDIKTYFNTIFLLTYPQLPIQISYIEDIITVILYPHGRTLLTL